MIKILGHMMRIQYDATLLRDREIYGWSSGPKNIIAFDPTVCLSQQQDTLLHEIIEMINNNLQLQLEHRAIQSLGSVLQQVIVDNPHIFKIKIPKPDKEKAG